MLAGITALTRRNNITGCMRAALRQRHDMIHFQALHLPMAVIAAKISRCLDFFPLRVRQIIDWGLPFPCAIARDVVMRLVRIGQPPGFIRGKDFRRVFQIVAAAIGPILRGIVLPIRALRRIIPVFREMSIGAVLGAQFLATFRPPLLFPWQAGVTGHGAFLPLIGIDFVPVFGPPRAFMGSGFLRMRQHPGTVARISLGFGALILRSFVGTADFRIFMRHDSPFITRASGWVSGGQLMRLPGVATPCHSTGIIPYKQRKNKWL